MNTPRCTDEDYIQFLLASPRMVSATEAARAQRDYLPARGYPGLAIRVGCPLGRMRFERYRVRTGISWYKVKSAIIRPAIPAYLAHPWPAFVPSA